MRRYFEIFRLFFLQTVKTDLVYRSQVLQRFFGIIVSLSVTAFFWLAASKTAIMQSYTPQMILAYFVVVSFHDFLFVSGDEFTKKLGESIRSGKLSTALIQPFPYLLKIFANGCGGICLRLCIVIPLALIAKFTFLSDFVFVDWKYQLGIYVLALVLAICVSLVCLIITGLLAFDMTHVWAPWVCFVASYCLFSGVFYPADLASGGIKVLMPWLPFYYMLGFPALILVGRLGPDEILYGFAHGFFVLFYVILILGFLWRRGIKKFEAIGI